MKIKKYIVDTTLRDGEQSPFVRFSAQQKIQLARRLDDIGVHQIEAGVVALEGQEEHTLRTIIDQSQRSHISLWCRLNVAEVEKALACNPHVVHVSVPVSYLHIYTKMNKNKNWIVNQLQQVLDLVAKHDCRLSVGFEDASRAEQSFLFKLIAILEEVPNMKMIRMADTVGGSSPFWLGDMVKELSKHTAIPLEIHAHNDLGLAVPNTMEALRRGAFYADTTLFGLGERSGNCDLEKLLKVGNPVYDFGIDRDGLQDIQEDMTHILAFSKRQIRR